MSNKEPIIALEPFLFYLVNTNDRGIDELKLKIRSILKSDETSLERRVFLRKFTNNKNIKGIFDYLPMNTAAFSFEELNQQRIVELDPSFVISPLNMDELQLFYKMVLNSERPVYPLTDPNINSKFVRNLFFQKYSPITVYIPQNGFHHDQSSKIQSYFNERSIDRVIVKDEYGFHSGENLEYRIIKVENLNDELPKILKIAARIEDVGGIIIEAFEVELESEIFKSHMFGKMIPNEVLKYDVKISGLEGIFKSHKPETPQLLVSVETSLGIVPEKIKEHINPVIDKYLPYTFGSIDFLIQNGQPKIIDVNSKAGSLGQIQEITNSNENNPFEFFVNRISSLQPNNWILQKTYLDKLKQLAIWKFDLESPIGSDVEVFTDLILDQEIKFPW